MVGSRCFVNISAGLGDLGFSRASALVGVCGADVGVIFDVQSVDYNVKCYGNL